MRCILAIWPVLILSLFPFSGQIYSTNLPGSEPTLAIQTASHPYVTLFPKVPSSSPSPWLIYPTSSTIWVGSITNPPRSEISEYFLNGTSRLGVLNLPNIILSSILADPSDPVGKLWFTENATLSFYSASQGEEMGAITFPGQSLQYLANDTQGRIWVSMVNSTDTSSIAIYNPLDGSNQTYVIPIKGAIVQGIVTSAQGKEVWFGDIGNRKIGRMALGTPPSFDEFSPPVSVTLSAPIQLAVDTLGNVWFTDHGSNQFGELDPKSNTWHVYPIGYCMDNCLYGLPNAIFVDATNTAWFSEHIAGRVGHYDPSTGVLTEYPIPGNPSPLMWWAMPGPGNLIWFVAWATGQIGYVNASLPAPLSVSGRSTNISVPRGFSSHIAVQISSQSQTTFSFGISPVTQDQSVPSQIYGTAPSNITLNNNSQTVSFTISAAWNATLESRYVTLSALSDQVDVSVPVLITVVDTSAPLIFLGFSSAIALGTVTIFLRRPKKPKVDPLQKTRK